MSEFNRQETNTILLTVLNWSNTIPAYPTDYTNPQVRISHVNGAGEIEDLAFINMAQLSGSNRWYHKYAIPITAAYTKYLVTFKAIMHGITTISTEEYRVTPPAGSITGTGEFAVQFLVKNSVTNIPIVDALVRAFDRANPMDILATMNTDENGLATVYLDAGNYLVEFSKTGEIAEVHNLTVNIDGTYQVTGD